MDTNLLKLFFLPNNLLQFRILKHLNILHIRIYDTILNSQHSPIKFTHETERNGCLSFLDVHVKKNRNRVRD